MTRKQIRAPWLLLLMSLGIVTSARGQAPPASPATNGTAAAVVGTWQGVLTLGATALRLGLVVTQAADGPLNAVLINIDQDGSRIPVQAVTLTGTAVHLDLSPIKASYDGTLDAGNREITGAFIQGMPTPLNFKRVDRLDAPFTFGEQEVADVRAVITEYFRAFTAKDFDAFRAVFQPPYIMWAIGGPPNVMTSLDDIVTRYRNLRDSLGSTDYAVTRAERMVVTPLSVTSALVDVHWRRDKKDGSLFGEGGEVLAVVRTPAGWKITGNVGRQLNQYGKVFP